MPERWIHLTNTNGRAGWLGVLLIGAVAALPGRAAALETEFIKEKPKATEKVKQGWSGSLKLGATMNFSSNHDVVGKQDGTLFTLGLSVDGNLFYVMEDHEWRTQLTIVESFSKTPDMDDFVKSSDKLVLDSIYLYHLVSIPWLGPFARVGIDTALLPGYEVTDTATNYVVKRLDGTTGAPTSTDRFRLTDAFSPFQIKETIGAFAKPLGETAYTLEFRLGIGGRHVFADGQYAIKDDSATTTLVEVIELEDYSQVGGEAGVYFTGNIWENKVDYKASAEAMMPFYSSGESDLSLVEQTNLQFNAGISFRLLSWLSIEYGLTVTRQPRLVDAWQITNNLLVSVAYSVIWEPEEVTKEVPAEASKAAE